MRKIVCLVTALILALSFAVTVHGENGPEITAQPHNPSVIPDGYVEYSVTATGDNLKCTWILLSGEDIYDLSFQGWWYEACSRGCGAKQKGNTFTWYFDGIPESLHGSYIYARITDGENTVFSDYALISVKGTAEHPTLEASVSQTVYVGETVELYCKAKGVKSPEYLWFESPDGVLGNAQPMQGNKDSKYLCDTETPGKRYYTCRVATPEGGRTFTNVICVTVLQREQEQPTEPQVTVTAPVQQPSNDGSNAGVAWMILLAILILLVAIAGTALLAFLLIFKKK